MQHFQKTSVAIAFLSAAFFATVLVAHAQTLPSGTQLLSNEGFEQDFTNWSAPANSSIDTISVVDGGNAAKISGTGALSQIIQRRIPVKPGQTLTASAWIKTENTTQNVNFILRFDDSEGDKVSEEDIAKVAPGTTAYTQYSRTITVPVGVASLTVRLNTATAAGSSAYFDLVSIFDPAGTPPPSIPTGLSATSVSTSQINLSWNASTGNVAGYTVYRKGTQIASVTSTTFQDTGLFADTSYSYTIVAYDASDNTSAQSASVSAKTKKSSSDTPSFEGLILTTPPGTDPSDPLLKLGYLDVTKAPYYADNTGLTDVTSKLQQASYDARDHQLVMFLPSGTYKVSDTIHAVMETNPGNDCRSMKRWLPTRILGSRKGPPPKIVLSNSSAGFGAGNRKPVIFFQSQGTVDGTQNCSHLPPFNLGTDTTTPDNYNHALQNVEIDVGDQNPGAVGLRMGAAQGSMLEDVKIDATGGFAGIWDAPGQGGGSYNVEITGGEYGAYITHDSRFLLMAGFKFAGQTAAAIYFGHHQPTVIVGSYFDLAPGAIGVDVHRVDGKPYTIQEASVALVDSVFRGREANVAISNPDLGNIYLKNVSLSPEMIAVRNGATDWAPGGTAKVLEYSYTDPNRATNLIDGSLSDSEIKKVGAITLLPTYEDVRKLHTWSHTPSFEDSDAVNATEFGVVGDGVTDTTTALQNLINTHDKIFLPKGIYRVKKVILRENTQLFGVGRYYTYLYGIDSTPEQRDLVTTVPSATGRGSLSFMHIVQSADDYPGYHPVVWRLGRNSTVRAVTADDWNGRGARDIKAFWVTGTGGGRWYGVNEDLTEYSADPAFRSFYVDGTTEPLAVYAANFERMLMDPEPMAEVANNARNVSFYYIKTESGMHVNASTGLYHFTPTLRIRDSSNVALLGLFGNANLSFDRGLVEVEDSSDVLLVHVGTMADPMRFSRRTDWNSAKEIVGSTVSRVPFSKFLGVFKRGNQTSIPNMEPPTSIPGLSPPSDGGTRGETGGALGGGTTGNVPSGTTPPPFVAPFSDSLREVTTFSTPGATPPSPNSRKEQLTKTLYRGLNHHEVKILQRVLIERNYLDRGNNTGFFGVLTEAAVRKLQCEENIVCAGEPASTGWGLVGNLTRARLNGLLSPESSTELAPRAIPPIAAGFSRNLSFGMQGNDVRRLQQLLNSLGFTVALSGAGSVGQETLYFGPATVRALVRFQEAHRADILVPAGLSQGNGFLGPLTKRKLQEVAAIPAESQGTAISSSNLEALSSLLEDAKKKLEALLEEASQ